MFEVIYSETEYGFLDQASCDEIEILRKEFSVFNIQDSQTDRPILVTDKHLQLFTFTGTRVNRTIQLLLNIAEIANKLDDSKSSFDIEVPKKELMFKWKSLSLSLLLIMPLLALRRSLMDRWTDTTEEA